MYSEIVLAGEKEKTSNIKKLNLLDVINLLDVKKNEHYSLLLDFHHTSELNLLPMEWNIILDDGT
jgi:hypothetical protein